MGTKWRKEEGAVIVVAVFVVLVLSAIGSLAIMFSTVELDISKNDRFGKEALFVADAGCPISTKVIRETILDEGIDSGDYHNEYYDNNIFFHLDDPTLLLNEVLNYEGASYPNDKETDNPDTDPDITTTLLNRNLTIDIDWRHKRSGPGGSVLFAMGYEGIGADRRRGGVEIYYDIDTKGNAAGNIAAEIGAVYLYQ